MDALFFIAAAAILVTGAFTVRRILRTVTSPILKVVFVCATVVVVSLALWVGFIILYYATGGH
jgi:hypothetical protein